MLALHIALLLAARLAAPSSASNYQAQCADLAKKNQLKPGLSVKECIAQFAAAERTRFYFANGVPEFGADSKLRFDLLALAVLIEYWHPLNQQRQMMVFHLRRVGSRWQWRMEEALREKLRALAEQTRNEKPRPGEVSASDAYAASASWDGVAESQQAPLDAAYQRFTREHPQGRVLVEEREKNREQLMLWKRQ